MKSCASFVKRVKKTKKWRKKQQQKSNKKKYVARSRCHLFGYYAMWHDLCSPLGSTLPSLQKKNVSKGKRYKAQWWSSNYTVDPHWSLTKHGITLRLFILGMLGKIYYHAKNCVSTTPLDGLRPIWTTQSLIMCPQGVFLSVFQGEVGKCNINGFFNLLSNLPVQFTKWV